MSFAHKTRVAVLRGGPSSQYEVSLRTGDAVLKSLHSLSAKYEGVDVFIDRDGVWHVHGLAKSPADALKHVDVAFVALHGQYGEDGRVQRVLEHLGVPYTGSEAFPSALALNKHLTKGALAKLADKVKLAWHKVFTKDEASKLGAHEIFRLIPHPSVVRPLTAGASGSVGVTVVRAFHDLESALESAFAHGDSLIIEELIEGKEAHVAVVEGFRGERHYALLPVEVDRGEHHCPARFGDVVKQALQDAALSIHQELGLRHYSRTGFIVHPRRGIYFLEANTLPALSSDAHVHESLSAVGSSMPEFLDHVLTMAGKR